MINNDELDICELTSIVDAHAMADEAAFPSGVQDFHFWHLYPTARGVHLRARLFLAKTIDEPANSLPFAGLPSGRAHIVCKAAARLSTFKYHEFAESQVAEHTRRILAKDTLCPTAADKEWWRSLCARYQHRTDFTWELPVATRCFSELPTEEAIAEVVRNLNLSLHDMQKINALRVRHFYDSPAAKEKFTRMSIAEIARKGLDFLPVPSVELTEPGADVARINERARQEAEERTVRMKRRRVIVCDLCALLTFSRTTQATSEDEQVEDPKDDSYDD
jgi:hypothetical protein